MVTPRGRIAVVGSDSEALAKTCEVFDRHGYVCLREADAAQITSMLQEELVDLVVVVGGGAAGILEQTALTQAGGYWAGCVLVIDADTSSSAGRDAEDAKASSNCKPDEGREAESRILARVDEMVTVNRLTRRLSDTRTLLNAWKRDLSGLAGLESADSPIGSATSGPLGMVRALVSVHDQIKDISANLESQSPFSNRCREHQCSVYTDLVQGIRHTIEILRKTKQSFKSKELGELRSYLEAMLAEHS